MAMQVTAARGDRGEDQRPANRIEHERQHGLAHHHGGAPVSAQEAREPAPVLDEPRIAEAELPFERPELLRKRELAQNHLGGIAGQNLGYREDDEGDDQQDDGDEADPLEQVGERHRPIPPVAELTSSG